MSLGGTGLRDWTVQRYTAVYLGLYTLFLLGYMIGNSELNHEAWVALFSHRGMQIGSLLALVSMALHAWIGVWVVLTDYVKVTWLRFCLQGLVFALLFGYFVWGIDILWG